MSFAVFATLFFDDKTLRFLDAILAQPGVSLAVVSQASELEMPASIRERLVDHVRVEDLLRGDDLHAAVAWLGRRRGPIHRLFAIHELIQTHAAEVRSQLGIEGMRPGATLRFRDKSLMKAAFREAGVPCARHRQVSSVAEAVTFAEEVGFPLIVKPPSGAGAEDTHRAEDMEGLRSALVRSALGEYNPVLLEEFITGQEHSFETITVGGRPVWHSLTRYSPNPLEVVRTPWIQWCVVLPREVDDPMYDGIREQGTRALSVLGMDTGLSHMEWFRRRDGSVAISEVGARPPGAQFCTLISRAHDFDLYGAWARLMMTGEWENPERKYAAGAAYLRGQGQGDVVRAIHGLDRAEREIGHLVTDVKLPEIGQGHSPRYEGDGYVILRHPETRVVEDALKHLVSIVRVELG
jgi:hypothetical protein